MSLLSHGRKYFARVRAWCVIAPHSPLGRWLPPTLWAVLIFILSSIPGYRFPNVPIPEADKGMHALLFFPLGFLLARAHLARDPQIGEVLDRQYARAFRALALATAYGILDETHQLFVPRRSFSLLDWLVDIFAAAIGIAIWFYLARPTCRSNHSP